MDGLCYFLEPVEILELTLTLGYSLKYAQHLGYALAAGGAFPAGFLLCEVHKEAGYLHHTGVVTHDDKSAGAYYCADLLERVEIERKVEMLLGEAAARGTAYLNGLELSGLGTAAYIEDYLAKRRTERHLDKAGVFYIARQGEGFGAVVAVRSYRAVPFGAAAYDGRNVCKGLDIIKNGGGGQKPCVNGTGRLCSRHTAMALYRGRERGSLSADEGTGTCAYMQMKAFSGTEYVVAEYAVLLIVPYRELQPFDREGIFCADIDVALGGSAGYARDYHALYHPVRITLHDRAVHECAGIALVAVADNVFDGCFFMSRYLSPLLAGREASAASAAQDGVGYFLDDVLRLHIKKCFLKCGITADCYVFLNALGVYVTAVLKRHAGLLAIEGDILLTAVRFVVLMIYEAVNYLVFEDGFFDYLLAILDLHLDIE